MPRGRYVSAWFNALVAKADEQPTPRRSGKLPPLLGESAITLSVSSGSRVLEKQRFQIRPWQCLNFLPEPQGQGALRATLPQVDGSLRSSAALAVRGRGSVATPPPSGSAGSKAGSSCIDMARDGSSCTSCISAGMAGMGGGPRP